jgi:hypothetical protein
MQNIQMILILAGSALAFASAARADVALSDGTFNNSDWSITTVNNGGNGGTETNVGQVATGGNPGAYRQFTQTVNASPGAGVESAVLAFNESANSTYDPSISGAISSIDFRLDDKVLGLVNTGLGEGVGEGAALIQNGIIYYSFRYTTRI